MKLRQTKGHATSLAQGLLTGVITSILITLAAAFLLAKLIDHQILPWEKVGYGIMVAIMIASFLGAWISYLKIKHQRLLVCGLSGLCYWLLLLSISLLFYGGQFEGIPVTAGLILAGCMVAFFLSATKKMGSPVKKRRFSHR